MVSAVVGDQTWGNPGLTKQNVRFFSTVSLSHFKFILNDFIKIGICFLSISKNHHSKMKTFNPKLNSD